VSKFVGKFRKDRDTFEDYNQSQKKTKKFKQNKNFKHFDDMDYSGTESISIRNPRNRKPLY
jgi:hypothetical protein